MTDSRDYANELRQIAGLIKAVAEDMETEPALRAIVYSVREMMVTVAERLEHLQNGLGLALGLVELLHSKRFYHYGDPDTAGDTHTEWGWLGGIHCTTVTLMRDVLATAKQSDYPIWPVKEPDRGI